MAVKEHDLVFEKDVNIAAWEYHVGCDCVTVMIILYYLYLISRLIQPPLRS